jgi:Na+-driven multidrug efflux pump
MTENRRIFWNIIATYGRSLYTLILGLLCGRWALMALGEVDYGLYGLVGGLAVFISFFNRVLAGANSRFYAFSVGAAKVAKDKSAALEECRLWFNTAVSIHTILPLLLIIAGYPLGVYAIRHWLTIPYERIDSCVWVFRFVCISCLVHMVNVPFTAMYNAKQYIAELTVYSFLTATLNVIVLYFMVSHPGDWLAKYAALTCLIGVVPQVFICVRACCIFPECRFHRKYLWRRDYIRKLGSFAGCQFVGVMCHMLRTNGLSIVINKFFGARMNAAQTIGNSVQAHCNTLAGAMLAAFTPVITQSCGARDYRRMNRFVIRTCKFNVVLTAIFIIPLALELPEVMVLWLKQPPAYATGLCYCAIVLHLISCCTVGHMVAVNAVGKIALYNLVLGAINIFTIPAAVVAGCLWHDIYMVMTVVILFEVINSIGRIVFARCLCRTSIREWVKGVIVTTGLAIVLTTAIGSIPICLFPASLLRVCTTTFVCEVVLLPLIWFVLLSEEERQFVVSRIRPRVIALIKAV